jgi:ATP-binding cassette, subfamily B, bacterial
MKGQHVLPIKAFLRETRKILKCGLHVWRLVPPRYKATFGLAALLMAVNAGCNTAIPLLLGRLVDGVKNANETGGPAHSILRFSLINLGFIAVAYLIREILNVVRRYLVENSCTRIEKGMTVKLVSHLMRVELTSLSKDMVGTLQGRISRDVVGFVKFLRLGFLDFLPPFLGGVFAISAALTKQPWLALAMLGVIPLSILLTIMQIYSQKGVRLKLIQSHGTMDGAVVELLTGLDFVRAANTLDYEMKHLSHVAEKRRRQEIRHHFQMSLFGCAKALNEGFFHVVVLGLAIYLAVHGKISFGDILTFSILFMNVMAPLNEIHRSLDEGHQASLEVGDMLALLEEPIDCSFSPPAVKEPQLENGHPVIATEDLAVAYSCVDGGRKWALHGVNLTIHHGETVGLAGRSGCGKTTWLRVIMRLAHPSRGKVLLGGVPANNVSREAIGRLIGYVGQQPFIFAGTIAENISYGVDNASEEAIREAARAAFIYDEILAMPNGFQTMIAERGQNLSGGQRQRLALARVFLKNPPLIILDEGTSALDSISERNVQHAIDAARKDHTVILVAHRLSTLLDVDRIFVFDQGKVVETGTYDELVEMNGIFAEMAYHNITGRPSPVPV